MASKKLGIFNVIPFSRLLQAMQSSNTYLLEALHQKYGMHPLQNGG
jgi:hypothetical protein